MILNNFHFKYPILDKIKTKNMCNNLVEINYTYHMNLAQTIEAVKEFGNNEESDILINFCKIWISL